VLLVSRALGCDVASSGSSSQAPRIPDRGSSHFVIDRQVQVLIDGIRIVAVCEFVVHDDQVMSHLIPDCFTILQLLLPVLS